METQKSSGQIKRLRLFFGLATTVFFLVFFSLHLLERLSFDTAALGLLAFVVGGALFSFSEQLGIGKLKAGLLEIENSKPVEGVLTTLPPGQSKEVEFLLQANSDLFPAIGVRILWVDDHPELLVAHRRLLRALGMEVIAVSRTEDAIDHLWKDGDFAVVIQDNLRDTKTKDSRALIQWFREREALKDLKLDLPLIMFTFDPYDNSSGVKKGDWIEKKVLPLLTRILQEVRKLPRRILPPGPKAPRV